MHWSRTGEHSFRFEQWTQIGWHLWLTFYQDIDEVLGQVWLSNFENEPYIHLQTFRSFEGFVDGLIFLTEEAARQGLSAPSYRSAVAGLSSDWLEKIYQEAKQRCVV